MILICTNKNRHLVRLTDGLTAINKQYTVVSSIPYKSTSQKYEMVLVDPTYQHELPKDLDYALLGFFDCEDDPCHFETGPAYELLKDKVSFYAKLNYVGNDRLDNIKNIAFPITPYIAFTNVAKIERIKPQLYVPFFVGTPTYIGNYSNKTTQTINDVRYIAQYENLGHMYNQRYQWLMTLKESGIPHSAGIVFANGNLSLEWQSKYFGDVAKLQTEPISHNQYLSVLLYYGVGLCPTGHERLSWRHFDIMCTGAVMIRTDHKEQKWLYNPVEYITVKDDDNIAAVISNLEKDFPELHKAHHKNKEVLSVLTPDKIWNDFLNQI